MKNQWNSTATALDEKEYDHCYYEDHVSSRPVYNPEVDRILSAMEEASLLPLNCWREQMESFYRKAIDEAWEEVKADGKV